MRGLGIRSAAWTNSYSANTAMPDLKLATCQGPSVFALSAAAAGTLTLEEVGRVQVDGVGFKGGVVGFWFGGWGGLVVAGVVGVIPAILLLGGADLCRSDFCRGAGAAWSACC